MAGKNQRHFSVRRFQAEKRFVTRIIYTLRLFQGLTSKFPGFRDIGVLFLECSLHLLGVRLMRIEIFAIDGTSRSIIPDNTNILAHAL